jgi:hypothetical protein
VTTLVRAETRWRRLGRLRSAAELDALLGERSAEVARVKSELDAFRIHYRQQVGLLHEQLDQLELAIAEAELGELSKRWKAALLARPRRPTAPAVPPPRYTSDAVRKLFRDVAKAIHPASPRRAHPGPPSHL